MVLLTGDGEMINIVEGNFLESNVEALVNTVNCVGVMGKGIALQSKQAFPDNFEAYLKACRKEEVQPGKMFVYETKSMFNPKYIINFPTKRHWVGKSRYEDIESGLRALITEICNRSIHSISIPPLGCGLGGLDWRKVRPMIEKAFKELPEVQVSLYEPKGSPKADEMPIMTKEPKMTVARALFIKLMQQYNNNSYRLTLLEIQKLAYFLQEFGEDLRLEYVKHTYGPYANNLNKVLERIQGHYISGYGDTQKPDVEIRLLPGAIEKADAYLANHPEAKTRLDKVACLVEGFETPYGMELLASVHWLINHDKIADDSEAIISHLQSWNERKKNLFKTSHINAALKRLESESKVSGHYIVKT
jgi:O-acetyl-ADP-ribose deacetylase (regulator of RNase III)